MDLYPLGFDVLRGDWKLIEAIGFIGYDGNKKRSFENIEIHSFGRQGSTVRFCLLRFI